jgi:hypothetical protein
MSRCGSATFAFSTPRNPNPNVRTYPNPKVLSFRAFGLVSVFFAFRFRACVLSEVDIW